MNHSPMHGKKTVALAGAMLLCGSMGLAQMKQPPSGPQGKPRDRTIPLWTPK